MESKEYLTTQSIPNDGQRVLCFGHFTICCEEDMDEEPAWHEVTFSIRVSSYKLKKDLPKDPEETIFEFIESCEHWDLGDPGDGRIIGVSKWKNLEG